MNEPNNFLIQRKSASSSSCSSANSTPNHSRRNSGDQMNKIIPMKTNNSISVIQPTPKPQQNHDISIFYYITGICREIIIVTFAIIALVFCTFFIWTVISTLFSELKKRREDSKSISKMEKEYNCSKLTKDTPPFVQQKCSEFLQKRKEINKQIQVLDIASTKLGDAITAFSKALNIYAILFLVVIFILSTFVRHV